MTAKFVMYLVYLAVSIGLVAWAGTTLFRNGQVFLDDVFHNERLSKAVNHLLLVGFYLINLGYVTLTLRTTDGVTVPSEAMETLSWKVGFVLLVLGGMHFFNVYALSVYRRRQQHSTATEPPVPPDATTTFPQGARL